MWSGTSSKPFRPRCPLVCEDCDDYIAHRLAYIQAHRIAHVLIACRWSDIVGSGGEPEADRLRNIALAAKLRARLAQIRATGADIWILLQVPRLNLRKRLLEHTAAKFYGTTTTLYAREESGEFRAVSRAMLEQMAAEYGIRLLDPMPMMCSQKGCPYLYRGEPVYFDRDHVHPRGGIHYNGVFRPMMEAIIARRRAAGAER